MDLRFAFDDEALPLAYALSVLDERTMPADALSEDQWRHALRGKRCVVVFLSDLSAAAVMVWMAGQAYLYSCAVMQELTGQGIGSALVEARVNIARDNGCTAAHAHTRVGNVASQGTLRKCGFIATKYIPDFYDDFADAIEWEMIL